jgi:DNA-binding MarR family transcriptional regulator
VAQQTPWEGAPGLKLTEEQLEISARLLLHIDRQPRFVRANLVPESLTQEGMATALRASRGSVSNALNRLVRGGALRVERSEVPHKLQRLKVYQLTPEGEALVRYIHERMRS